MTKSQPLDRQFSVLLAIADLDRLDCYAAAMGIKRATLARNLILSGMKVLEMGDAQQPARAGGKDKG